MKRFTRQLLAAVALAAALAGCEKASSLALVEREERRAPLYRQAIAAEQAGNLNEAIQLFEKLLISDPGAYSAHFQLATLLQDSAHDYIGAIHHYRVYLALRPESDKASAPGGGAEDGAAGDSLVNERIRKAQELLAPQLLAELGDSVEGISQAKLMRENERLENLVKTLTVEKGALSSERNAAQNELRSLRSEAERLRALVQSLKNDAAAAPAPEARISIKPDAAESSADVEARRDAVRKLRAEAAAHGAEGPGAQPKPAVETKAADGGASGVAAALKEARKIDAAAAAAAATPAAGETPDARKDARETLDALLGRTKKQGGAKKPADMRVYVVQPGDTLFRIAEKFYGDQNQWKKIRNANRSRIDPDGRIRAGQSILIP